MLSLNLLHERETYQSLILEGKEGGRGKDSVNREKRIKRRNFTACVVAKRTDSESTFASCVRPPSFFLFSFARCAPINSNWRTRGGSRFKESHTTCASPTRKSQSEPAIYGAGYRRAASLSKCTQIRSSPRTSNRRCDLFFDLAPFPRSPRFLSFSADRR